MEATLTKPIHVFEEAGLGRAPFRFIGAEHRVGPIEISPGCFVGAPGQPMGSCQYCGQGIADCCIIRDADGKTFVVGNVCVNKTGDKGIIDPVKRAMARIQTQKRHARADARIKAAKALLEVDSVMAKLRAEKHPMEWRAKQGATLLDWVEWMFSHAGAAGSINAAKVVEDAAKQSDLTTDPAGTF